MIPLWIVLRNFGPYVNETIDLRGIRAATIVGPMGSGKTLGIPEAITWCYFWQCRAGDPDAFIRTGQTDAAVTVGFLLNGETYRATRARSIRTKRGKTEFSIQRQVGDGWEPVDRSIEDLLKADYDTLTASNFIMQEDPFDLCKARPKDRIALISNILGLGKFDEYAKRANKKMHTAEAYLKALIEQQETVAADATRYEQAEAAIAEHEKGLAVLRGQIEAAEKDKLAFIKQAATLEAQIKALPEDVDLIPAKQKKVALETEQARIEVQLSQAKALAEKEPELAKKEGELTELDGKLTVMRQERQTRQEGIEQKEKAVAEAQAHVDAIKANIAKIQQRQADIRTQMVKDQHTVNAAEQWVAQYTKDTQALVVAIGKAEAQAALLTTVPCGEDLQRRCGFTKAAVAVQDDELPKLRKELAGRETELAAIFKLCPHDKAFADRSLANLKAEEADLAADIRRRQDGQEGAGNDLAATTEDLRIAREALKRCEATISSMEQHCATIRTQLADLPKIQHYKAIVPTLQDDLARTVQALNNAELELSKLQERVGQKATLQAQLDDVANKGKAQETFRMGLASLKEVKERGLLAAQMTLAETKEAKVKLATFEQNKQHFQQEIEEYGYLVEAYKRVPVLIIDNATPIIEAEANKALLQLSFKGMQLRFESQKALKTVDKVVDQIDIYVRDRDGERVYETYSGGEKGLANFATRLGISKLTSSRSGAKIETLIVDETFAAMGEEVVPRVREYLESLSEQYPLVLVITHDATLKGTLPSQITMIPSDQGTKVMVTTA